MLIHISGTALIVATGMNTGLKFGLDPKVLNGILTLIDNSADFVSTDNGSRGHQRQQRSMLELFTYEPSQRGSS